MSHHYHQHHHKPPKHDCKNGFGKCLYNLVMIAAFSQAIVWLPQIIQIFRTGDVSSFSLYSISLLWTSSTVWFVYGVYQGEKPLIISGSGASICTAIIIGSMFYYG